MESFFILTLKRLFFKDNLVMWTVMLCVNFHQKLDILHTLLLDFRNLQMAWMRPPDAGGTSLTKPCVAVAWFPHELIDAVTCCTQYSHVSEPGNKINTTQWHDTGNISNKPRVRTEVDATYEKMLDTIAGSPATGKSVTRIMNLFVDDLFGTGGTEMEHRVLARLSKDFQVGSEDWSDVTFTGQRIRWMKDSQSGPCIEVSQQKAIDELKDIPVERNTEEDLRCSPAMHTRYRSLLREMKCSQSRTQFQCCCKFSRCASMAASPTIGDVKAFNKLARQLKSLPAKLQFWPLTGPLRIIGFPDASKRNNEDGSSQRGMTVFLAESREPSSKDGMSYGSLIDFESQRIRRTVLSTTVAELYSFMKCFGSCQFLHGLRMDISGEVAKIHMRTDA